MSKRIREHVGQLIVAGFAGPTIPIELRAIAREFDLGGVILFARNIEEPAQVAELAFEAGRLSRELPVWVSVDQEGGRVARLRSPFTEWPPMITLGRSGDPALAERFARSMAAELAAVGVTLDYAPVLDVDTNPDNPVIGDRSLSREATDVARLGGVIIETLQECGIAACGKHFPGHGDTAVDSHEELPVVEHPPERIREVELEPFREAIRRRVAAIMTAHVRYPALDESAAATLSAPIVTGLLRDELGFEGLIATDDMQMGAIAKHHPVPEATVRAVAAGCDMVLLSGTEATEQVDAFEAIIRAVEEDRLPERRVDDALDRQRRVKERFLEGMRHWRPPTPSSLADILGRGEHVAVAREMERFV